MKKPLLITAGTLLLAGGVYYLYEALKQENGNEVCQEGTKKCIENDLYKCTNGQWVIDEINSDQCLTACSQWGEDCDLEGFTRCDDSNNLCYCQGGKWKTLQLDSAKCRYGETHKECFVQTDTNISWCLPIPGAAQDRCWGPDFPWSGSEGCSCDGNKKCTTDMGYPYWCDPDVKVCIADRGGTHIYYGGPLPDNKHIGQSFTEDMNPYNDYAVPATQLINARIEYKNAIPGDMFDVGMYIVALDGSAVHIYKGVIAWWGGSGVETFTTMMFPSKQSVYAVQVYVAEVGRAPELDNFNISLG